MSTVRSFPIPSEMPDIPGTEGWREMYPAHLVFSRDNPEQIRYENSQFWFLDSLHAPYPFSPLDCYSHDMFRLTMPQAANRIFMIPMARGFDQRIFNGYLYLGARAVEDPQEIEKRAALFEKRAGYYYQNWSSIFQRWHRRMEKIIEDMESIQFVDLPDLEPESTVIEGRGYGASYLLIKEFNRLWDLVLLSWNYHFELLNLAYTAYAVYIDTAKSLFPDISDKAIGQSLGGFDSLLFRAPEQLQTLARQALEEGLADALVSCATWQEVLEKLPSTQAGTKWLESFNASRHPWFEMSCGIGWYHHEPTWNQNLDFPFASIKRYIEALRSGKSISRRLGEVVRLRDEVVTGYRALLQHQDKQRTFDQVHGLAAMVAPFAEDHMWYCTNYEHAIFFRKLRQLGGILANHGIISDSEDIFFFNRYELPEVLHDLCSGWAIGGRSTSSYYWPKKIARRKEILTRLREWQPLPALGPAPESMTEPIATAFFGITTERIDDWLSARQMKPGDTGELRGNAASSGVAEGIARVCRNIEDISALELGEVMVTSTTSPTWAPAFQVIAGCVTDIGGTCCHAAIVAREHSMPAVVGTGVATQTITTGDVIRVDGDTGMVTILKPVKTRAVL